MKIKKLLAVILMVAVLGVSLIIPSFAASAGISGGTISDGTAKFTLTISGASGAQGTLSASGGTITSVTGSGSPVFNSGSGQFSCAASNADSVTLVINCSTSSDSMSVSYKITYANDKEGNDATVSPATGSATATAPATTAAATAAPKTTASAASTAANLKSISIKGYTLSPKFRATTTKYSVVVPKDVTSLDVTATPADSAATVTITGDKNFTAGKANTVKIVVKGTDGTSKTYTITTAFAEETTAPAETTAAPAQSINLQSLTVRSVKDFALNFSPDVYKYTVKVPAGTKSLDVQTALEDGIEGNVDVNGADNLKEGQTNVITVTVTSADGTETVYTINVEFEKAEKKGMATWLAIILMVLFLVIGFVIGFLIGKKKGGNGGDDDDDDDRSPIIFGGDDDDEEPKDAPVTTGLNFGRSSGMSFNPPIMHGGYTPVHDEPEDIPVPPVAPAPPAPAPIIPTPIQTQPPVTPVAPPAPTPAPATDYLAAMQATFGQATAQPPVAPAPDPDLNAYNMAPALPYQPATVITDENMVRPAPKPIAKNPFEKSAD